jgi:long-chain acyl-CoA synthetase
MAEPSVENLHDLLISRAASLADKPLLVEPLAGRSFTYQEFENQSGQTAALLVAAGVRKGDRVSIFLTNRAEYLLFYFACFEIGAWAGPINAHLKPAEVEFLLNNSGAVAAVTEPSLLPILVQASARTPALHNIIIVGEDSGAPEHDRPESEAFPCRILSYEKMLGLDRAEVGREDVGGKAVAGTQTAVSAQSVDEQAVCGQDEAIIIYTSGTTGKPKGVLLTHSNLLANAKQIAEWLRLTEHDRSMIIMPLFHVNALMTTCLAAIWAGGSIVLTPRFSASRYWNIVSDYGVTYFGSVATMLSMLNNTYPLGLPEGVDTSRLRYALCGSAPVPVEVLRRFEELFSCPVIEGYGLSESTCRSTFNPVDRPRPGSVGLPIGNEMKIFDDADCELPPGQVGEIVLRGANIMKGYYQNEDANRKAFQSGWFHTGDLGYQDEDGFFYVVDRKSDMIIRGGENVYPREIDEVLYQHPDVKDAATIGVPDPLYGEEVKSFVVLRDGRDLSEGQLLSFCQERLAAFKCPRSIEFLDDIPKGPTGKLLKRELARLAGHRRSAGDLNQPESES